MWIYIYNYDKIIYKESKFPSLTLSYVFSFIERSFVSYFLFTQPCDAELYNFVKENLVIIAGVAIGIAVILVSLNWPHLKFPQPVCRTLWNKSLPQNAGNYVVSWRTMSFGLIRRLNLLCIAGTRTCNLWHLT